ncbi:MAG: twin-arginine translocase subunit TatC [Marinilabiliales bacterium]|nr:MAG: twin-arginine translocase subunit TatC [Marinilabiliales bacterium]
MAKRKNITTEASDEMTFLQHLDVFRWHLVRSIIAVVILTGIAFAFKEIVFDHIILAPKNKDFFTNKFLCKVGQWIHTESLCLNAVDLKIVNIKLSGQFMMHLYISFFMGVITGAPYLIWELWRFIRPALRKHEKKHSRGAVLVSSLLFLIGVLFSYFIVVPLTLNFFGNYEVSESVKNTIALNSYVSTVVSVTMGVGIVFEMPIIAYFLSKVGILTPAFMRSKRKIMIVIIMVIAAIITPADIFSMFLVAIPLLILYELSIHISKRIEKRRLKREKDPYS